VLHALRIAVLILVTHSSFASDAVQCEPRGIPDDAWVPTSISAEEAMEFVPRRLLVMRSFWHSGSEALVIADPREAGDLFFLLAGNSTVGHACGFHWALVFEDASRKIVQHLHNKDCEAYRDFPDEIQERLHRYFRSVDDAPTHHLLDVEIDPAADPNAVAKLLERDGRLVFFLAPPDARFPRLSITQYEHGAISSSDDEEKEIEIQARTRAKIDSILALLASRERARVFEEPMQCLIGTGDGMYEYGMRATVVFPLSFDETRLKLYEQQLRPGSTIDFLNVEAPEEPWFERPVSYTLTLASPEPWSKELERSIRKASPAIRKVTVVESRRLDE